MICNRDCTIIFIVLNKKNTNFINNFINKLINTILWTDFLSG